MRKLLLSAFIAVVGITLIMPVSVFAADCPDGCVPTAILGENGCSCDSGNGDSIIAILNLVVNILTVGIGILGVIGITIVGIQYLTAGGNEEKTRKAKRRMFEIIIGLIVYAIMYALLQWLGINPGTN
ncbi:hypothetical protein IJH26_01555 [Candidatus Saccharibacteria bacterium]|nr:hypothetical protein [Candidatus Saccharibacteria bacterium]MBQ3476179.1 hypothetical protein [Candidatus Saccharibacteria bacterium]